MKIGILQTGRAPYDIRDEFGDYDDLFKELLNGKGLEFATYAVLDGEMPATTNEQDGWLITGSKYGVYEDHPWIPPLEEFIRRAYADETPLVGVCFGHQIIAQALGGKVEKYDGGWSVGPVTYQMADGSSTRLIAWHQDQVVVPPDSAEVVAATDFCKYASLRYGDNILTIQPHPEFSNEFGKALLKARGDILPTHIKETANATLGTQLDNTDYADKLAAFLKHRK